ncbi:uncharacterized protein DUF3221 [Keratinibaculum paraultunense]|uniref:Uncharacterized protein DUF3221 n=1 Tax=Keratinibaculum paraultunense TaxID=1278232 RepID=A0A4R3KZW7_9FIRM|nr:DUF3221 domain-containing protein [Keratinibaculum paraultunense]QQY79004.1 DUF3221 domain-containing protein [Keratinibaculum paraultunense]TCS90626.1 uncharacterized protein DUF3221 [Keratinibaculum paraultunense]
MKRLFSVFLIFSIIFLVTACNKESIETIGIRGEIKEIYMNEENALIQSILVEGHLDEDTMYESANVAINNNTDIYKGDEKVTVDDLEEGLIVEVIFEGAIEESYPVQGTAKKIKILAD